MSVALLLDVAFVCHSWSPHRILQFLTNWTLVATIIVLMLSIWLNSSKSRPQSLTLRATHHFLFELTSLLNAVTMVVYWGMLHQDTLVNPEYKDNPARISHNLFVHIAPGTFYLVNWLISDVVF